MRRASHRGDAQRLYRALVLLWARVERVLLSETSRIPESVITQVSTQLGLTPAVLSHLRKNLFDLRRCAVVRN